MSRTLSRLVYHSRNRIVGGIDALGDEIEGILVTSRFNNARVGVTGALMFNASCFAQILEGPAIAVEETFERIQLDARHGDVSLLVFEAVDRRAFGTWSMGFVGAAVSDAVPYEATGSTRGFQPINLTGQNLLATLVRLAHDQEKLVS